MKLFNMKENTKKILIFYRAITLNISFQIKVGTNLEKKKKVKFKTKWSPFKKKTKIIYKYMHIDHSIIHFVFLLMKDQDLLLYSRQVSPIINLLDKWLL